MKIVCPTCKNITTWEENPWRPFCSERCKLIDLDKWVSEEYVIKEEQDTGKERVVNDKDNNSR